MAFVLPEGPVYPLPLYELALMAAARARRMEVDPPALTVVTPEPNPLAIFGGGGGGGRLPAAAGRSQALFSGRPRTPPIRRSCCCSRRAWSP